MSEAVKVVEGGENEMPPSDAGELPAPLACSGCDGLGWYTPMGPDTFNRSCSVCDGTGKRAKL
jgi:hypothetical protein